MARYGRQPGKGLSVDWLDLVRALIVPLASGGVLAAVLSFRQDRRRAPIETETAAVANARTLSEIAMSVAEQAQEAVTSLQTSVDCLRKENARLVEDNADIKRKLSLTLDAFTAWADDITTRWDWWRTQEEPPTKPQL